VDKDFPSKSKKLFGQDDVLSADSENNHMTIVYQKSPHKVKTLGKLAVGANENTDSSATQVKPRKLGDDTNSNLRLIQD